MLVAAVAAAHLGELVVKDPRRGTSSVPHVPHVPRIRITSTERLLAPTRITPSDDYRDPAAVRHPAFAAWYPRRRRTRPVCLRGGARPAPARCPSLYAALLTPKKIVIECARHHHSWRSRIGLKPAHGRLLGPRNGDRQGGGNCTPQSSTSVGTQPAQSQRKLSRIAWDASSPSPMSARKKPRVISAPGCTPPLASNQSEQA